MSKAVMRDPIVASSFPIVEVAGLNVTLLGGSLDRRNTPVSIPAKVVTLTDNAVNYLYVEAEGSEIAFNTTGFPEGAKCLWTFRTVTGAVTETTDNRAAMRQAEHTRFFTRDAYVLDQTFNVNADWALLDLSALVPVGTKVVWVRFVVRDSGAPGAEVYFGARKPGEVAYSQWMKAWPQVMGQWSNVCFPVGLDADRKMEISVKVSGSFSAKMALLGLSYGG